MLSNVINEKKVHQEDSYRDSSYNSKRDKSYEDAYSFDNHHINNVQNENKSSPTVYNHQNYLIPRNTENKS